VHEKSRFRGSCVAHCVSGGRRGRNSASAAALRTSIVPSVVAQHGVIQMGEVAPSAHLRLQVVLLMRNLADLRTCSTTRSTSEQRAVSPLPLGRGIHGALRTCAERLRRGDKVLQRERPRRHAYERQPLHVPDRGQRVRCRARAERQAQPLQSPDRESKLHGPGSRTGAGALDVPVLSITGLDNFELPFPKLVRPGKGRNGRGGTGSGPGGNFIGKRFSAPPITRPASRHARRKRASP